VILKAGGVLLENDEVSEQAKEMFGEKLLQPLAP
jgi:hypothetical protein